MREIRWSWALLLMTAAAGACSPSAPKKPVAPPIEAKKAPEAPPSCARAKAGDPGLEPLGATGIGSAVALARWQDRTVALVADVDDRAVQLVDVDSHKRLATTKLEGKPSQLVVLKDGRAVVALRDKSKLVVLDPAEGELVARCTVATPAEPVALALTPKGEVMVASGWGHSISAYGGDELAPLYSIDLGREPRALAVSADGATAFVVHAVGGHASVVDLAKRAVRRVTTEGLQQQQFAELRKRFDAERPATPLAAAPPEDAKMYQLMSDQMEQLRKQQAGFAMRTACQSFALARSELPSGRVFAPQVLVDPGNLEQRAQGYGNGMMRTEVPSVAVIDEKSGLPMVSSLAIGNDVSIGSRFGQNEPEHCMLPRAAAVDDQTQSLLVACWGIDSVVSYDAMSADPVHAEKRRWRVPAGPSGIAIDAKGRRAVVWSQFDHALAIIPLDGGLEQEEGKDDDAVARVEIDSDPERQISVAAALGRSLFHSTGDTRIAKDGRACASCHPDGRDDGLVWATPNGPRRTKMLAGMLAGTAPFSWDGKSPELRDHLQDTFKRLSGEGGLRSVELRALVAYIESLDPPPRAPEVDTKLAARGSELFHGEAAGCATCHRGDALTDRERHDVQSKHNADRAPDFDTPSLRFVSGRAPYFHDGRYGTLRELLTASDGKMGHTAQLSQDDLIALEVYLRTL